MEQAKKLREIKDGAGKEQAENGGSAQPQGTPSKDGKAYEWGGERMQLAGYTPSHHP